jgi:hypothetical protein
MPPPTIKTFAYLSITCPSKVAGIDLSESPPGSSVKHPKEVGRA